MEINLLTYYLLGVVLVLTTFVFWLFRRQDYFKNHGIPHSKSPPLLGSFAEALMGKTAFYDHVITLYNKPEVKGKPFFGMFLCHKPGLMVNDPELIKRIFVKDFNNFTNRYSGAQDHDPIGFYQLFSLKGPLWKSLRAKLSPFFSSGKLKSMYHMIDKVSNDLNQHVQTRLKNEKVELELKELASLYSTDVIATCAFGVEANSLQNPDGEFRKAGMKIFEAKGWRKLELPAWFMVPQVTKFFNFKTFTDYTTKFMQASMTEVMNAREKSGNKRNDLIDTLLELKKNGKDADGVELTDDMLMAQAAVFFSAGELRNERKMIFFNFYEPRFKTFREILRK